MATTTNYSWTTPDDTALVKDGAAAIRSLGTAIDTTVFNNAGAAIAKTIVDAKGDLIVGTAADTVARLASSASNGDLLTVDTSTASGLKWAAPAAAGGMTLISETVASAVTGIDLTSISGSYKQLLLIWDGIEHSTTGSGFSIRFNSDSNSNYIDNAFMYQSGGVGAQIGTGANSSIMSNDTNQQPFGYETANSNNYTICARGHLYIDNYASTSKYKLYYGQFSHQKVGIGLYYNLLHGAYKSTSAITSINIIRVSGSATISNLTNSSIRLYGIS